MTPADDTPDTRGGWLGTQAAGRYLDIHPEQVRLHCRAGKVHFAKLNGHLRFKQWWLDAYVEGRTAEEVAAEERRRQRAAGLWTGRRAPRKRTAPEPDRAAL